ILSRLIPIGGLVDLVIAPTHLAGWYDSGHTDCCRPGTCCRDPLALALDDGLRRLHPCQRPAGNDLHWRHQRNHKTRMEKPADRARTLGVGNTRTEERRG